MGKVYAAVSDLTAFGRSLTAEEQEGAQKLLETASAKLRVIAKKYGADIDRRVEEDEDYSLAVRQTVVQAVIRAMNSLSDNTPPAVQSSQSALGYSLSMTWLNSGQSLYFLKNELKDLGLLRQRYGTLEVYDFGSENKGDDG